MAYDFTTIIYEKKGAVAKLTMNRPEKLNAWLPITSQEFRQAFEDCQNDDSIRVLVITGAGRAFSSGEDVSTLRDAAEKFKDISAIRGVSTLPGPSGADTLTLLNIVQKPVVAAVNGVCAGGAMGIAMAADVRIASENAVFHHTYLRMGLVPSAEVWFLPRIIGLNAALQHLMMADSIDAQEAYRLGFVYKVVPHENLEQETMAIADHLAQLPPMTAKLTRKAVYYGLSHDLPETMQFVGNARAIAFLGQEMAEGAHAFLEKRKPTWK